MAGIISFLIFAFLITAGAGCGKETARDPNRPMLTDIKIGTMPGKVRKELNEDTKITNETLKFSPDDEILIEGVGKNLKTGTIISAGLYENGEAVLSGQQEVKEDTPARAFTFLLGYGDPMPAGVYPLEVKIISPDGNDNDDMYFMKMVTIK